MKGASLRNTVLNVANHRETNHLITAVLLFLTIYTAFCAILGRNLLHPLSPSPSEIDVNSTTSAEEGHSQQLLLTNIFSLFILWLVSLSAGYLLTYGRLPPLLGMLLVGAAFTNIHWLRELGLVVLPEWEQVLRRMAFIVILMRCGMGLKPDALRESLVSCKKDKHLTSLHKNHHHQI